MNNIKNIIRAGMPVLLVGMAGTAKTSVLRQFAKENNREVVDLRVAMMPPEDLVGIPKAGEESFSYLAPDWVGRHCENEGENLMIILEEIHLAPPSMHAALYQLLQEKELVGHSVKKAWIACTANPPEQAGASICAELPEALRDRLEVINFDVSMVMRDACDWLRDLANTLGISREVQELCGVLTYDLAMTPRACERLLRLISAGVTDDELIMRRAGNIGNDILQSLDTKNKTELIQGDILSNTATKRRIKKSLLFGKEGIL